MHALTYRTTLILFTCLVSACGDDSMTNNATEYSGVCPETQEMCQDECVNTHKDTKNCGGCGHVCADAKACIQGMCDISTDESQTSSPSASALSTTDSDDDSSDNSEASRTRRSSSSTTDTEDDDDDSSDNSEASRTRRSSSSTTDTEDDDDDSSDNSEASRTRRSSSSTTDTEDDDDDTGDDEDDNPVSVEKISSGGGHTCVIDNDGAVRCWGSNYRGQIGMSGFLWGSAKPIVVDLGKGVTAKAIAAGGGYTCVIDNDDAVRCWGSNSSGKLGTDEVEWSSKPIVVDLGKGVTAKAIDAEEYHTCVIDNDDAVRCWGSNSSGQLGTHKDDTGDDEDDNPVSVDSGPAHPGREVRSSSKPRDLGEGITAKAIAAGGAYTCVIDNDDAVRCWGDNSSGQLGTDEVRSSSNPIVVDLGKGVTAKAIDAGGSHTCVIDNDDAVRCWGDNSSGQLGTDEVRSSSNPIVVDLGKGVTAKAIDAGGSHTCVIDNDDAVRCWGDNSSGQLGTDEVRSSSNPIVVDLGKGVTAKAIDAGGAYTCEIDSDDAVRCWGSNSSGQLGHPRDTAGDLSCRRLLVFCNPTPVKVKF